jgi:cell fate regulator YaaT (PSP1 superfamily)
MTHIFNNKFNSENNISDANISKEDNDKYQNNQNNKEQTNSENIEKSNKYNGFSKNNHNGYQENEFIPRANSNGNNVSTRFITKPEDKSEFASPQRIIEVVFHNNKKELYYLPEEIEIHFNDWVVVETENGVDIANVSLIGNYAFRKFEITKQTPVYSIKHKASSKEIERQELNIQEAKEITKSVQELADRLNINIKITGAEWQLDHHKLTVYFLSPHRVDFRELVRELARNYKSRIELRQITHRESAKLISNAIGICGRQICCSSFLTHIKPISVEHAKVQQLSTNVTKLSGYCGRLKCCLLYEHELYCKESDRFPKMGSILHIDNTEYKLIKFDIFKDYLTFYSEKARRFKNYNLDEVNQFIENNLIVQPSDHSECKMLGVYDDEDLEQLNKIID